MVSNPKVIVIGAGLGGLSAALELAYQNYQVAVLEQAYHIGGKVRTVAIHGRDIDCGPTVLTMRGIFEQLFIRAQTRLEDHLQLAPLAVLARHAWPDGSQLDLFAEQEQSTQAIEQFAGKREAQGFGDFCRYVRRIYEYVEEPFLYAPRPTFTELVKHFGLRKMWSMARSIDWQRNMWTALGDYFSDPRLRQLFGRYATYYGSSPFHAPATLNLIAHVEQEGVWVVEGGMQQLANAIGKLIQNRGGELHCGAQVSEIIVKDGRITGVRLADEKVISGDIVVFNGDLGALANGSLGVEVQKQLAFEPVKTRSLSAITWATVAETSGFSLCRHNVFFSRDYEQEFSQLEQGHVPSEPTVYICAQDRIVGEDLGSPERLFCLINAPARGDTWQLSPQEVLACQDRMLQQVQRCGLTIHSDPQAMICTTPHDFNQMFPASGGALYGPATHGWRAAFQRGEARSKIPGLYLVGGGVHPGAGLPMVALSGHFAAQTILHDFPLTSRSPTVAMPGGTSTESATTVNTPSL